jgi:hypothetical protein
MNIISKARIPLLLTSTGVSAIVPLIASAAFRIKPDYLIVSGPESEVRA